jgi:phytoene desaturase
VSKVVVIGAGIGGMAVAVRLARAGCEVVVLESADGPGGKLSERKIGGYRFDLGPSLFTLPELVDELFTLCGEDPALHFSYRKLASLCTYFWNDGQMFSTPADPAEMVRALSNAFNEDPADIEAYVKRSASIYRVTAPVFLHRSLQRPGIFSRSFWKGIAAIPWLPLRGTLHQVHKHRFRSERITQYFNRYATYNGSDPYQAPAMMMLVPHLEHGCGAYLPQGGMFDITRSVYQLALRQGVEFRFNTRVDEILHDSSRVTGVMVNSERMPSDVVVSNMDMHPTYRVLLKNFGVPEKLLAQEKSSSALIFYWGIKGVFSQLDLHNIFFSDDYRAEFDAIFRHRNVYEDPTIYVNITSKHVRTDAPDGCENWFVMINMPHDSGQHWPTLVAEGRRIILAKLSSRLGMSIEGLIEVEDVLDPVKIEQRTSSFKGALYGNASNNPYAAFLRHSNKSSRLSGLYFCGGSVHPGGGIPLCLFGARIAGNMILEDIQ